MYVICNNQTNAYVVLEALGAMFRVNPYFNKSHLITAHAPKRGNVIGIWTSDEAPTVPKDFPIPVFIQGVKHPQDLIDEIIDYCAPQKAAHRAAFETIKQSFPQFEYEIHDTPTLFWVRIKMQSYGEAATSIHPLDLNDLDAAFTEVFNHWLYEQIRQSFRTRWPYLYLYGMDEFWTRNQKAVIYINMINTNYPDHHYEGTSTGIRLEYPLSIPDAQEMDRLNLEAQKAMSREWFFCTRCHSAKPKSDYAYYLFHDVRCKQCADPAWLKRAHEETYN